MILTGRAFDKCPACSDIVIEAYRTNEGFLMKALGTSGYLEQITGLKKLQEEATDIEFEWDGEDE